MRVLGRLLNLALLGFGLSTLTACHLGGIWMHPADPGGGSGYSRYIQVLQICTLTGGECRSSVGSVKFGATDPSAGYTRKMGRVDSWRRVGTVAQAAASDGNLFDPGYFGVLQADTPAGGGDFDAQVTATTTDSDGDSWINGGGGPLFGPALGGPGVESPTCTNNIVLVTWFTDPIGPFPLLQPVSSRWKDTTVCNYVELQPGGPLAQTGNPYSTSSTEYVGSSEGPYRDAMGSRLAIQQNPGGLDSIFGSLSWDQRLELYNSIDPEADRRVVLDGGRPVEVTRIRVTGLRIGGRNYTPVNAHFDVWAMNNITVDLSSAGWRLLQAWTAAQLEDLLARRGGRMAFSDLRWSVTLNDTVTLTSEDLKNRRGMAIQVADVTQQWVTDLRRNAAFGRRE